MTKNDFIYALKTCGCLYHNEQIYYEENELIRTFEDMEMFESERLDKALSQEPCDAISRDMALEKMADYVASGYADSAEDFEEYSRIICQLPSVTQKSGNPQSSEHFIDGVHAMGYRDGFKDAQKQKSGRWKVHKKYYECSNCESQISNEFFVNYRFCPHCGAKMESEDKE